MIRWRSARQADRASTGMTACYLAFWGEVSRNRRCHDAHKKAALVDDLWGRIPLAPCVGDRWWWPPPPLGVDKVAAIVGLDPGTVRVKGRDGGLEGGE